jgi:hypothetical protein
MGTGRDERGRVRCLLVATRTRSVEVQNLELSSRLAQRSKFSEA